MGSETADHMEPRTMEEQIRLAQTPSMQSNDHNKYCASGCIDGKGYLSYVCPGCTESIGPDHDKELNMLRLSRKARPGHDDFGVAARTKVK
jgi:hypothetical protein